MDIEPPNAHRAAPNAPQAAPNQPVRRERDRNQIEQAQGHYRDVRGQNAQAPQNVNVRQQVTGRARTKKRKGMGAFVNRAEELGRVSLINEITQTYYLPNDVLKHIPKWAIDSIFDDQGRLTELYWLPTQEQFNNIDQHYKYNKAKFSMKIPCYSATTIVHALVSRYYVGGYKVLPIHGSASTSWIYYTLLILDEMYRGQVYPEHRIRDKLIPTIFTIQETTPTIDDQVAYLIEFYNQAVAAIDDPTINVANIARIAAPNTLHYVDIDVQHDLLALAEVEGGREMRRIRRILDPAGNMAFQIKTAMKVKATLTELKRATINHISKQRESRAMLSLKLLLLRAVFANQVVMADIDGEELLEQNRTPFIYELLTRPLRAGAEQSMIMAVFSQRHPSLTDTMSNFSPMLVVRRGGVEIGLNTHLIIPNDVGRLQGIFAHGDEHFTTLFRAELLTTLPRTTASLKTKTAKLVRDFQQQANRMDGMMEAGINLYEAVQVPALLEGPGNRQMMVLPGLQGIRAAHRERMAANRDMYFDRNQNDSSGSSEGVSNEEMNREEEEEEEEDIYMDDYAFGIDAELAYIHRARGGDMLPAYAMDFDGIARADERGNAAQRLEEIAAIAHLRNGDGFRRAGRRVEQDANLENILDDLDRSVDVNIDHEREQAFPQAHDRLANELDIDAEREGAFPQRPQRVVPVNILNDTPPQERLQRNAMGEGIRGPNASRANIDEQRQEIQRQHEIAQALVQNPRMFDIGGPHRLASPIIGEAAQRDQAQTDLEFDTSAPIIPQEKPEYLRNPLEPKILDAFFKPDDLPDVIDPLMGIVGALIQYGYVTMQQQADGSRTFSELFPQNMISDEVEDELIRIIRKLIWVTERYCGSGDHRVLDNILERLKTLMEHYNHILSLADDAKRQNNPREQQAQELEAKTMIHAILPYLGELVEKMPNQRAPLQLEKGKAHPTPSTKVPTTQSTPLDLRPIEALRDVNQPQMKEPEMVPDVNWDELNEYDIQGAFFEFVDGQDTKLAAEFSKLLTANKVALPTSANVKKVFKHVSDFSKETKSYKLQDLIDTALVCIGGKGMFNNISQLKEAQSLFNDIVEETTFEDPGTLQGRVVLDSIYKESTTGDKRLRDNDDTEAMIAPCIFKDVIPRSKLDGINWAYVISCFVYGRYDGDAKNSIDSCAKSGLSLTQVLKAPSFSTITAHHLQQLLQISTTIHSTAFPYSYVSQRLKDLVYLSIVMHYIASAFLITKSREPTKEDFTINCANVLFFAKAYDFAMQTMALLFMDNYCLTFDTYRLLSAAIRLLSLNFGNRIVDILFSSKMITVRPEMGGYDELKALFTEKKLILQHQYREKYINMSRLSAKSAAEIIEKFAIEVCSYKHRALKDYHLVAVYTFFEGCILQAKITITKPNMQPDHVRFYILRPDPKRFPHSFTRFSREIMKKYAEEGIVFRESKDKHKRNLSMLGVNERPDGRFVTGDSMTAN